MRSRFGNYFVNLPNKITKQLTSEARVEGKLVCIMPCKEEENKKLNTNYEKSNDYQWRAA